MPNANSSESFADRVFLTVEQVAEKLKISKSMVYRLISVGELVCHAFGTRKLVLDTDLESFCASRRIEGPKKLTRHGRHF